MGRLPVPVGELSETLRVDFARSDLAMIASQAQEQVAVHKHATRAATEVLHTVSAMEIPNRDALIELRKEHLIKPDADEPKHTASGLARQMVKATGQHSGVADKDVKRDILSRLHPDRQLEVTSAESEDTFKAITDAQQHDDETLVQGLYAETVATSAAGVESPSAATLEKARYKAWLALQAGKGRFETKEEVDAWKERELALAPHRIRAGLLGTAAGLFAHSLGATEQGSFSIPSECFYSVSQAFDTTQRVVEKIMGDEVTAYNLSRANLVSFDKQLTNLLGQLDGLYGLLGMRILPGMDWSYLLSDAASRFGRALSATAKELEGYREPISPSLLGSIALAGLSGDSGEKERRPDKERLIISDDDFSRDIMRNIIKRRRNEDTISTESTEPS